MKYNSEKLNFTITVATSVVLLVIIAGIVIYVDPYFHFHKPFKSVPYSYDFDYDIYQTEGVMRNFDYDSVIVGTSTSVHLVPSILDEFYGTNTIKAPTRGGSTKGLCDTLKRVFGYHPDIKRVIYDMDYFSICNSPDMIDRELPDYLYDNNVLNDTKYLFDKKVILDVIPSLYDRTKEKTTNIDDVGAFYRFVRFSRNAAMTGFTDSADNNILKYEKLSDVDEDVKTNINKILIPIIKDHPDTEFYIYIPPYSVLLWCNEALSDRLSLDIVSMRYAMSELLKCDNVTVFFFCDMPEIEDLYRYSDTGHWDTETGATLCNAFINKSYVLSAQDVDNRLDDFAEYVCSYNYDIYNGNKYEFQKEDDLDSFLTGTDDEIFTRLVLINKSQGEINESALGILENHGLNLESGNCAIIAEGSKIIDKYYSEEPFSWNVSYNNKNIQYVTSGYAEEASILINGYEYCPEEDCINIVIYDRENNRVLDSIGYDSNSGQLEHY